MRGRACLLALRKLHRVELQQLQHRVDHLPQCRTRHRSRPPLASATTQRRANTRTVARHALDESARTQHAVAPEVTIAERAANRRRLTRVRRSTQLRTPRLPAPRVHEGIELRAPAAPEAL